MVRVRDDDGHLSVGQAASRVGVTVRALRHWDETGLARPSLRSKSGYRLYTDDDLERLRRIVVYRELGLDHDAIRHVLDDPDTDVVDTLRAQQAALAERIARLHELAGEVARMIEAHDRGILLTAEEQHAAFGPAWNPHWQAEARHRYGDTVQWRQFAERAATRSAAEWHAIAAASAVFERALADAIDAGVEPGSTEAHTLVARHREVFSAYFPITRQMQLVLGRMYEADASFAAHYNAIRPGLASWLRRSIDAAARAHGIDPDAATWQ